MSHLSIVAPETTQPTHTTTAVAVVVGNNIVIWLDANFNESHEDYRNSLAQLKNVVDPVNIFTAADVCIDFLKQIKNEKTFLIVSGALGESTVPRIHSLPILDSIYIFCGDKIRHEQWSKDWSKIKGVFVQIAPLCALLQQNLQQVSIPVSFVSVSDAPNESLNQLDPSFICTKIAKEIFLATEYDQQSVKDFATYFREKCTDNNSESNKIAQFEQEYYKKLPVWWYTHECYLYSMLHRALRTQDMQTIIKMGFFIRDVHRQIDKLYSEQLPEYGGKLLTVYRGQAMPTNDFEKLNKSNGGILSFNNFLSTSTDRDVSLMFAESNANIPNVTGILFEMIIDTSIPTVPFARIDSINGYPESNGEILFSTHTAFRIRQINLINDGIWKVQLTLMDNNDQQLNGLTEQIRELSREATGWHRLGESLIQLGDSITAEQVYTTLLDQTSDDAEKAQFYHQLGRIKDVQRSYTDAIGFYEKSLEIYQRVFPADDPALIPLYNIISTMHYNMEQYASAIPFCEKAMEIREKILPPNDPQLAISYSNIALMYTHMTENQKALPFYEKALKIYQETLPSNDPNLAQIHNDIGTAHYYLEQYTEAASSYERAIEIGQLSDHPDLEHWRSNLEFAKTHM